MNKRTTGTEYETLAAKYLEQQGYKIIEKNFRCRQGEIDLIAREGPYLVFIEVKYRKNASMGTAIEAVNTKKQNVIRKVASYYLVSNHLSQQTPCRFDVIGITGEQIELIKNAF